MPEIYAPNLLSISSQHNISNQSSHWINFGALESDRIMTSLNLSHEYADLDEILDVDDRDDLMSGGLEPMSLNVYDESYIEDLSHLCSENSEITQQHYQAKIDIQRTEEFPGPNEEGLLEALQRSMENFESSTMSDLTSLSSSLGLNFPDSDYSTQTSADDLFADQLLSNDQSSSSGMDDATPLQSPAEEELVSVDEQVEMEEEKTDSNESMLKQLLLNPCNSYRREVDSITIRMKHAEKAIGNGGNPQENQRHHNRKMKKKKLPKKPFTELLKHLESANTTIPQVCSSLTKPQIRVLNAKNYIREYGSAPASRVNSPEPDLAQAKKANLKSSARRSNSSSKSARNNILPKKPIQVTKVYPISQSPIAALPLDKKTENMIVAPDLDSLLDLFENETSKTVSCYTSRKGSGVEPLTFRPSADKRKGTVLIEPLPKKRKRNSHEEPEMKVIGEAEVVSVCHEKPSSDHDYCEKHGSQIGEPSPGKVVQWEQYLQRVRSGTRSAPNSPTSSPKVHRKQLKNKKMAKSALAIDKTTNVKIVQKSKTTAKPTIKLQEFQEYLANLQSKPQSKSVPTTPSAEIVAPPKLDNSRNSVKLVQSSSPITVSLSTGRPMVQQAKPITLSQPFIQVKSGGKIHTAAVTSSHTGPRQSSPLVMIRIPPQPNARAQSPNVNSPSLPQKTPSSVANIVSQTLVFPRVKTSQSTPIRPLKSIPVTYASISNNKRRPSVAKTTKEAGASHLAQTGGGKNPTFKLMTSSKGKSVILSNVTGQLKEILTVLAQQQQQQGYQNTDESSTSQQKTLQKLLATIIDMKKKGEEAKPPSTSNLVTGPGLSIVPSDVLDANIPLSTTTDSESQMENLSNTSLNNPTEILKETCANKHSDLLGNMPSLAEDAEHLATQLAPTIQSGCVSTHSQANSCQSSDKIQQVSLESNKKTIQSPVNQYLKSVIKATVDNLLNRVAADCSIAAGVVDVSNDVDSIEKSNFSRSLTFTEDSVHSRSAALVIPKKIQISDGVNKDNISEKVNKNSTPTTNVGEAVITDDQYYNKLPAYLYSGKLLQKSADKTQSETESENIEYNKLPHYFSSGKLAPSESASSSGSKSDFCELKLNFVPDSGSLSDALHPSTNEDIRGLTGHLDIGMEQEIGFTTEVKCTPEGKVIDPEQTFYSRLPSYYGYGRTHVVDTVTEPPTSQNDETVTKESLDRQHKERLPVDVVQPNKKLVSSFLNAKDAPASILKNEKLMAKERVEKRSQKRSEQSSKDRIMYSKIPSYLLSGRQPLARERRMSEISSLSESSDSEGVASTSIRRRSKRFKKSSLSSDWESKQQKQKDEEAKNHAILQRRVMYVGGISEVTSKAYLRARFQKFGAIDDVTLYFRRGKDNYAFVTFRYSNDVIQAIEHGNDNVEPKYTLCFGGRRHFCKEAYADLDDEGSGKKNDENEDDFDTLLQKAMRR